MMYHMYQSTKKICFIIEIVLHARLLDSRCAFDEKHLLLPGKSHKVSLEVTKARMIKC